jgi:hypothetical protein
MSDVSPWRLFKVSVRSTHERILDDPVLLENGHGLWEVHLDDPLDECLMGVLRQAIVGDSEFHRLVSHVDDPEVDTLMSGEEFRSLIRGWEDSISICDGPLDRSSRSRLTSATSRQALCNITTHWIPRMEILFVRTKSYDDSPATTLDRD